MTLVRVSAYLPDERLEDLGEFDARAALAKFDSFPWAQYLQQADEMERNGIDGVDADLTFSFRDVHFMARIKQGGRSFEVEAWVPRLKKLLGIFGGAKCYEFRELGKDDTRAALEAFLTRSAQVQHELFAQLRERTRKT